jgi:hypothetical protein
MFIVILCHWISAVNRNHVALFMTEFYDYKGFILDHCNPPRSLRQAHRCLIYKVLQISKLTILRNLIDFIGY